jgi:hypothetical protein
MDKFINTLIIIFLIQLLLVFIYRSLKDKFSDDSTMVSTMDSEEEKMREEEFWNNISEADRELLMEMNAKNYKPFNFNDGRQLGPVINFHQMFNDKINNPKLRELGWRKFYLRNASKNLVKKDSTFKGTGLENFLYNLESNRNVYMS